MKAALLFDLGKRETVKRPKHLQVKQRRFTVHYGAMYVLVTELSSERSYYGGRLKPFQVLTEEVERHEKGVSYAIREAIMGRLEG